jgi:uncharacterized membrane protein
LLVAATIFPVWGLARARFGPIASLAVAGVAALYPILWANGVGDFHEMAFVPLLSAALVYFLDRRHWPMSVATALLLLCTKEDQFFVVAANGLLFAVTARGETRAKRAGFAISTIAVAMALIYFGVVRQVLNPHVPYAASHFFNWTPSPSHAQNSFSAELLARAQYALIILAPLAFVPCVSRYGLFLVPGFLELLASHQPVTLVAGAHYSALLTGYALAGFVDGVSLIRTRRLLLAKSAVLAAAAISVSIEIFASPMEYWYYLYRLPNAHDALLNETLSRLPPGAAVGSEDEIFAHLGLDPNASANFANQKWFVYDSTHYSERWHDVDAPAVRRALALHKYIVASDRDGIVVLKRSSP